MKIVFVSEHYPPTDGGVATSTQRIARSLQRIGASVHVFCFDNSRPLSSEDYVLEEIDEGVRVSRVGPFFLKQKSMPAERLPEKVKASFRRRVFTQIVRMIEADGGADIVMSFYLINAGYIGAFVARAIGVPHVAGVRGNDIGRNIFHVERFGVTRWIVDGADRIVCVNEFLQRRMLLAFPEAQQKSSVIPNSVAVLDRSATDPEAARARILSSTGWDSSSIIATFIGTLREKKGVLTLLLAIAALPNDSPVRLMVVGPPIGNLERHICGDLWDRLVNEGRVWYTGRIRLDQVASWGSGADLVVMPSLDDGMANGLLEGMSLGLCPVVTEIFGDVVSDGENGVVVPSADNHALASALQDLAKNPAEIERLSILAQASITSRTPDDEGQAYLDLFGEVLQTEDKVRQSHG